MREGVFSQYCTTRARGGWGRGLAGWLAGVAWPRARVRGRLRACAPAPVRARVCACVRVRPCACACACARAGGRLRPCARACVRACACARPCAPVRARASRVRARNDTTTADGSRSESVRYAKPRHYAPPVCRAVDGPPRHYAVDPSHTPRQSSNGFCTSYPQLDIMRHHPQTTLRA
jgi:hypothetical protein